MPVDPGVLLATAVAVVALETLAMVRRRVRRARVVRCLPTAAEPTRPHRRAGRSRPTWPARLIAPQRSVPVVIGLGAAAVIGRPAGLAAGAVLGLAAWRFVVPRVRSPAERRALLERERLVRQLPLTAELLAACLAACSSPVQAVDAVEQSVEPPMRDRLAAVAAQLRLGAPPEECWERFGADCPPLAPLAACLVRTSVSGAPPAAQLSVLAQTHRQTAARAAHARVRRAGVLATAPLGVCFLPAFVLIGVAPVVMGLTSLFAQRV